MKIDIRQREVIITDVNGINRSYDIDALSEILLCEIYKLIEATSKQEQLQSQCQTCAKLNYDCEGNFNPEYDCPNHTTEKTLQQQLDELKQRFAELEEQVGDILIGLDPDIKSKCNNIAKRIKDEVKGE